MDTPKLVKPDGERIDPLPPTPVAQSTAPVTHEQFLAAIKDVLAPMMGTMQAQVVANTITASAAADAASDAATKVYEQLTGQWWDVRNFPNISNLNPLGEREHPRTEVVGEVFWMGCLLRKLDLLEEEIGLINRLRPGIFHHGHWKVVDLAPGQTGTRKLLVLFPCRDPDQRANLPSMIDMLREMTAQTAVPALH